MFNLLPEPEKKQILDEYNARRTAIALAFLFIVGLIAIIAVFPAFVLSSAKERDAESTLGSVKNSPVFQEESQLNGELSQANLKLLALRPPKTDPDVAAIIQTVISHKGPNIRLNEFLYTKGAAGAGGTLSVDGVAMARADLSAFVDALKTDPMFTNVNLPVSSFAEDQNADFSLQITGTF